MNAGAEIALPFWGPILESDLQDNDEAANAQAKRKADDKRDKHGRRGKNVATMRDGKKEDCLTLMAPIGSLDFTLPMLVGKSGYTSKLALALHESEEEVVRADSSLNFYQPLLESGGHVSVALDIHTPLLWSEKFKYDCQVLLEDCTVHHTKVHVPWFQALIAGLAGETLVSAPKDFVPVIYTINVELKNHNILWPTNRFNMMLDMADFGESPKASKAKKREANRKQKNWLKQPVDARQRNNSFMNFCGDSAKIHFALDYDTYFEEMRKVVYTITSPVLRAQLLLPETNTVMQNVVQLSHKAFWDLEGFDLRIGTVFHTLQNDPDLIDKCLTDITVDTIKGPLLGYFVPRLLQWCVRPQGPQL